MAGPSSSSDDVDSQTRETSSPPALADLLAADENLAQHAVTLRDASLPLSECFSLLQHQGRPALLERLKVAGILTVKGGTMSIDYIKALG